MTEDGAAVSIRSRMEQFGDFRLERRLDSGGEFAFFRATRSRCGSDPYRTEREACVVLRFSHQVAEHRLPPWADPAVAVVLHHRAIVRMLDAGEIAGRRFFSFELVDGVDLRHLLDDDPLPRNVALFVTRTIVEALSGASAAVGLDGTRFAFLHGDIRPRWVFASRSGEVKLGGFGFGYIKPERQRELDEMSSAPEQLLGDQGETAQVDIFQVGLVLHRMLFASEFVSEALARIVEVLGRAVAPSAIPVTDPALDQFLRRLLAERPEDRFSSIKEVRAAIESILPRGEWESEARASLAARVERALSSES
jgi:eukaryotic-like serine/threonine-protein kinase